MTPSDQNIPYGLCQCGCGQRTKVYASTNKRGDVKGEPARFLFGHNRKINDGKRPQDRRYEKLKLKGICIACGIGKTNKLLLCEMCRVKDRAKRRTATPLRKCEKCGVSCQGAGKVVYCANCRSVTCQECGEVYRARRGSKGEKFCSRKCQHINHGKKRGKDAPNWQGGKTREKQIFRARVEYRDWRREVFVRDGWTCQDCGTKTGLGKAVFLHAHHLKESSKYPELRLVVGNGLTLCKPCHHTRHSKRG